ncbi:ABC transporter permease [Flavobacterium sp. Arc3]|jgi:ABC-2 type transport system permease protein|uniref:ABC transporter permease n=1 Tax=unclassified Flavobacterium TaxID=196869 RepID=UPI00352CE957
MQIFLDLLKREFKLFWQNKVLRLLFIGAPLLYGIMLGYVYEKGKVTNLPILVVDEDQSEMSATAIQMFEDNEVLHIASLLYDQKNISEITIQKDAACVVIIPKGFEKMVLTRKYPEIVTIVNASNILTANYASSAIQLCLGTLKVGVQLETLRKQGVPEKIISSQYEPFKTTYIKKYNRSSNYMYFLWPGVLGAVLQQVLLLGLALSFASEFELGTFKNLIEKCPSLIKLIAVKIIPYLIMSFGLWILYWLFTLWFRIPVYDNIFPLTIVAGIFIVATSFMGILVSIMIPSQIKATEVLMVVATPSFILSGFTWPLSQMPIWVQEVANAIPLTHFLKAFRVLIIERGNFSQTHDSIINLLIISFICGILSYIALYFKKKNVLKTEV